MKPPLPHQAKYRVVLRHRGYKSGDTYGEVGLARTLGEARKLARAHMAKHSYLPRPHEPHNYFAEVVKPMVELFPKEDPCAS